MIVSRGHVQKREMSDFFLAQQPSKGILLDSSQSYQIMLDCFKIQKLITSLFLTFYRILLQLFHCSISLNNLQFKIKMDFSSKLKIIKSHDSIVDTYEYKIS